MQKGDTFPHFALESETGEVVDSDMLKGLRYIIFFYARDNTPGCTTECVDFTELYPKFALRNIPVFGVSGDSVASHKKFAEKHCMKIKLLTDTDHALAKQVGAYGEKNYKPNHQVTL